MTVIPVGAIIELMILYNIADNGPEVSRGLEMSLNAVRGH